jgi:hypothetical protein
MLQEVLRISYHCGLKFITFYCGHKLDYEGFQQCKVTFTKLYWPKQTKLFVYLCGGQKVPSGLYHEPSKFNSYCQRLEAFTATEYNEVLAEPISRNSLQKW